MSIERIRIKSNGRFKVAYRPKHAPGLPASVPVVEGDRLLRLVGKETIDEIRARVKLEQASVIVKQEKLAKKADKLAERMREREAQRLREKWTDQTPMKGTGMTVSLYKSMASGAMEVVVQTNAQSLDIFISALADALHAALVHEASAPNAVDNSQSLIAATLKNAFPVAYAISGYKAEKVSESKLLTCGFASPDASELLAQSKQ